MTTRKKKIAGFAALVIFFLLGFFQNCSKSKTSSTTTTTTTDDTEETDSDSSYASPYLLTFPYTTYSVKEGNSITVTVNLSTTYSVDKVFQYKTVSSGATEDVDFEYAEGELTISAGDSTGTITLASYEDEDDEDTEVFYLQFGQYDTSTNYRKITIQVVDSNDSSTSTDLSEKIITMGLYHSCFINSSGAAYCWGSNDYAQLGDGTTTMSTTPVEVSGLDENVTQISAGQQHTCAIVSGALKCWGLNNYGQLGNNSTTTMFAATAVSNMSSGVTDVSAGGLTTCAIKSGALYCWGANGNYQLANGKTTSSTIPVAVSSMTSGVTAVSVGTNHVCAIKSAALYCWGYNNVGQLGNGNSTTQTTPQLVSGLSSNVTDVSVGFEHTCAVQSSKVKCWGGNSLGQIGSGNTSTYVAPYSVKVSGNALTNIERVYTSVDSTCMTTDDGITYCWGNNGYGQLGVSGTYGYTLSPKLVSSSGGLMGRSMGYHFCGYISSTLNCWGYNYKGQLGKGDSGLSTNVNVPTAVSL